MFKYESLSPSRKSFVDAVIKHFPDIRDIITRDQIREVMSKENLNHPQWLTIPENKVGRNLFGMPSISPLEPMIEESDEEISTRISNRYQSMETLISAVASNTVNSLVIAGAAGLGKSFTVNKVLSEINSGSEYNYVFHRGYLRASHLFRLLWENRHKGQTIVLDDTDSIFGDETALNILKAALELKSTRRIGWGSEKEFLDEDGDVIPRYFDYEGSVIFLTNLAFHDLIASNNKYSPHLSALESRSLVLDLGIKTKKEYLIKIRQTVASGMLREKGFSSSEESIIMEFVESNVDNLRELSLRMVEKIASLFKLNKDNWKILAKTVCCK